MKIEFDPVKSQRNGRERGLPLDRVVDFDWEGALYREDDRRVYPERRFVAIGALAERLHVLCFTPVPGGVRIISLRRANAREVRAYEEEIADGQAG